MLYYIFVLHLEMFFFVCSKIDLCQTNQHSTRTSGKHQSALGNILLKSSSPKKVFRVRLSNVIGKDIGSPSNNTVLDVENPDCSSTESKHISSRTGPSVISEESSFSVSISGNETERMTESGTNSFSSSAPDRRNKTLILKNSDEVDNQEMQVSNSSFQDASLSKFRGYAEHLIREALTELTDALYERMLMKEDEYNGFSTYSTAPDDLSEFEHSTVASSSNEEVLSTETKLVSASSCKHKSYATKLIVVALEELANALQREQESISAANSEADESENSSSAISGMRYFSDTSANTLNDQLEWNVRNFDASSSFCVAPEELSETSSVSEVTCSTENVASKYSKILGSSSSEHRVFAAKLIMEALKELTATFRKESCLQKGTDEN